MTPEHQAHRDRPAQGSTGGQYPSWFPGALAIAMHQDKKSSWPWYGLFQHWLFVSWRCECCMAEKAMQK